MKKKSPTIGQQRLEKLAKFLYTIRAEKFYMGTWRSGGNLNVCGSTACAIGWASTIFKNDGLLLEAHAAFRPAFNGLTNWPAVMEFFDLSYWVADQLFGPNQDIGPRGVAKRIKSFLKTGKVAA